MLHKNEKPDTYLFLEIPEGNWEKRGVEKKENISLLSLVYSPPLLLKFEVDKWYRNKKVDRNKTNYSPDKILFIQSMYSSLLPSKIKNTLTVQIKYKRRNILYHKYYFNAHNGDKVIIH